ncbi:MULTISPECIES: hypothetical protein [Mesorhizobium]|uniref:hypothetical protein n=1 Tax=Mesorhizobium TaxID=68287 RepID=UPI000AF6F2BF|nr:MULTISPECIES: hypothetical protein [Mesorhizobium]MDF3208370.1 hypothetical protein [Mesorhizobium sp. LMG15046]MDF3229059.1 hypothetical protein [Mesorhizobium sp. DSM 30133]
MPNQAQKRVMQLQRAIKVETDKGRKRALQSRLRDLCHELARRDYRAKLADLGNMAAY